LCAAIGFVPASLVGCAANEAVRPEPARNNSLKGFQEARVDVTPLFFSALGFNGLADAERFG
jgi:hypothetical protein